MPRANRFHCSPPVTAFGFVTVQLIYSEINLRRLDLSNFCGFLIVATLSTLKTAQNVDANADFSCINECVFEVIHATITLN